MKKLSPFLYVIIASAISGVFGISPSAIASSSGWHTSYGSSYSGYYPPSYHYGSYGRGGGAEIVSLDLDPQNLINSSFRVATREGRLSTVEELLVQGAEIDSRSAHGQTALMYASRNCAPKLARFLVQHGANINAADFEGKTALILASRESCLDVVSFLVKCPDLNVDAKDQMKKTALDYAGENALLEVGGPSERIMALINKKRFHMPKKRDLGLRDRHKKVS